MILVQNDYFTITEVDEKLFIQVFRPGFSMQDFQVIMQKYPRMGVTKFLVLKSAIENATLQEVEFGKLKPKFDLMIASDNLEARIKINLDKATFEATKEKVKEEILELLKENNIIHGILYDVLNRELVPQKEIAVARGTLPNPGSDAHVVYLEIPEMKPTLTTDGRTNYYDMNLFKYVHKGDWLGEKVLPRPGVKGMNIKGEELPGKSGKDKILRFDPASVEQADKGDRIILVAKCDGALQKKNGKIGVINHLTINGNVGPETGNIDFDGYVTVKGTVEDGFSVIAQNDISILGSMGVGAVEQIYSKLGNVYIKGGVSGRGKSVIQAGGSVFVKYANTCTIIANEMIDIGYYALDSNLEAATISVQAKNGRTIGGIIRAKTKVTLRMVGNVYEKETYINVEGFDRRETKKQLDALLVAYKELLVQVEQNERELKLYEMTLTEFGRIKSEDDYESYQRIHQKLIDKIYILDEERQKLMNVLLSKGEGEVTIYEKAYPRTLLQIKNLQKRIQKVTTGTFYAQDNELKFD